MSVLSKIFKECPQVKILEVFAENADKMYYLTEIGEITGITKITIADHINKLLKEGIIEKKNKVGRKQYYQLNEDNNKTKIILSIIKHIDECHLAELIIKNEEIDVDISFSEDKESYLTYSNIDASGNSIFSITNSNLINTENKKE